MFCLLCAAFGVLVACSTPQQRYKTLSFFFDGVPNPDAKKAAQENVTPSGGAVITASIVSKHKPYLDGKCDTCHRTSTGGMLEFEEAYKLCVQCHKTVPTQYPKMHGPVAVNACQWCHTGHESSYPALLKDAPITVCTQCHDPQLLGPKPPQHTDGRTSCISCHAAHGGQQRFFLKPNTTPEWPTTAPAATQSATQPTTHPARQLTVPK